MNQRTPEDDLRLPRKAEARAASERPDASWVPASTVPDPEPMAGYRYRWVRTTMLGAADLGNVDVHMREGWIPVTQNEQPTLARNMDTETKGKDTIVRGGLMLMKIPEERAKARDAYMQAKALQQLQAVDSQLMKESDARMPLFSESKTEISRGPRR